MEAKAVEGADHCPAVEGLGLLPAEHPVLPLWMSEGSWQGADVPIATRKQALSHTHGVM